MMARRLLPVALALAFSVGCRGATIQAGTPAPTVRDAATADPTQIRIVALSDFHGWLAPLEPRDYPHYFGGIANLGGYLLHREKLDPKTSIILDNGDMWTGPREATFLRGASVIEAYNALGISAANVANHEFDFGVDVLEARAREANFPLLGANIVRAGTMESPAFVKPWVILERDGVKIGVVGLSYRLTPKTTHAQHVAHLEFLEYAPTLKRVVPEIRRAGAEVLVVLFHDELSIAEHIVGELPELGIDAVVAGQNHRKEEARVGPTPVVNPGPFGRSYVRFDVRFDRRSRKVLGVGHEIVDVTGDVATPEFPPRPELEAVVKSAQARAASLSTEVLGRIEKPLGLGTFEASPLGHFIADTWLSAYPEADAAMCNHGGLRQPLASGPVTLGDIIGVMPFENNLFIVRLSGKQLKEQLTIDSPVVAGLTWSYRKDPSGKREVVSAVDRLGKPIVDTKTYKVVINDFMYLGGDGYGFKAIDPHAEDTGISWRQPVINALRLAESTNRRTDPQTAARARALH